MRTIVALRAAYRDGTATPGALVEELLSRRDEAYRTIWIQRCDPGAIRRRARDLEDLARRDHGAIDRMPLFGVPYAVKDNIDAAGMPTTAGCPAFAYVPRRSATVVEKLDAAGAILVGKTNLDQFATGLVGTRSPYGVVPNAFRRDWIAGGSSSGSAVAVARGHALFALGTDTAGSGRVPAALNNVVGLKPSRGLVSARGVVPACQSVDCVSVLALTVPDALAVLEAARGDDPDDPYSRSLPLRPVTAGTFRFAAPERPEFHGDEQARRSFDGAVARLAAIGGRPSGFDMTPFLEVAALLYEGPWVAERMAAIAGFFAAHADEMHPVVREIIGGAGKYSAADAFAAATRLAALTKVTRRVWDSADVMVVPTVPTVYRIDEALAEPFTTNRRLGHYTNFVNLLDLAALAVPASMRADGLPAGITLIAPAGSDLVLADIGRRFHEDTGLALGASDGALVDARAG